MRFLSSLVAAAATFCAVSAQCPDYSTYSQQYHAPFSAGHYNLSYMRPQTTCRTFRVSAVDNLIKNYTSVIKDPDLYRLFENSC